MWNSPLRRHVGHGRLRRWIVLALDLLDDTAAKLFLHFIQWIQEAIVNGEQIGRRVFDRRLRRCFQLRLIGNDEKLVFYLEGRR